MWPWNLMNDPKNDKAPLLYYIKLCASFQIHQWIQTGVTVWKRTIGVKIDDFSSVTLQFDIWPWKTIGHLFYATSSFVHHFVPIGKFKLELQSWKPNLGQIQRFLEPCDLEIWRMTSKYNRAPLLSNIKLYASFHHHMGIQTGVTVRKRLSGVLTCDLELWPLTLTFCMDVTSVIGNNSWKFHDDTMMGA